MRRTPILPAIAISVLLAAVLASIPALAGNTGMLQVSVADPNGAAIEGALLIVTDPLSTSFRMEAKADRTGRAVIVGLVPRAYNFKVQKDGYQAYESNFDAHAGETTRKTVTLQVFAAGAVVKEGAEEVVVKKKDPWAVAYNEAVPLYRDDKDEEALAKLDEALALKADFAPALMLKGIMQAEHGRCEEAVPSLKQAYTSDPNSRDALGPLIRCLEKAGQNEEAASYRKIQSETGRSKADLYNEAVVKINGGDDAGAAPLLEQALAQDASFAAAVYQYGLVLFRRGDVTGAVSRLEAYVNLAPAGEFAADARDLLKALKP